MADIIQFPNKKKQNLRDKAQMLQNRLDELAVESRYINEDIDFLNKALITNKEEMAEVIKQFTEVSGLEKEMRPFIDLASHWGELTPEKEKEVENKLGEIGDVFVDVAKKLEDAVRQLTLDLDINSDKPEDK